MKPKHYPERMADYERGLSDYEMARAWSIAPRNVIKWRKRRGLPTNNPEYRPLDEGQRAARMLLYSFGYSDARIAREQSVAPSSIRTWRGRLNLVANRPNNRGILSTRGHTGRESDLLMRRIKRALPAYLSPTDRDEVAQELIVAVLTNAIPIADIEARAKLFGNGVIASFANKWGARSLDEEIGDSDGFTLLDTIADDSASSWLEEMGATVW